MIFIPPTNQVDVATYLNHVRTSAQCGYLQGQVDRLQREVDFLEYGLLIFFGLLTVTVAALLMSLERNRRTTQPGKLTASEESNRTKSAPLNKDTIESETGNEPAVNRGNAIRWCGLIFFWAVYNGGILFTYLACAPDWRKVLFMTLALQSIVALTAFCALWRPRFRTTKTILGEDIARTINKEQTTQ